LHGAVIQILDDADAAFSIFGGAELRNRSVRDTMYADKPHRPSLTILPPVTANFAGWATSASGGDRAADLVGVAGQFR